MPASSLAIELAFAVTAAAIGGAIASRLGLSVIVGFIAAGMAIGPFTPGFVGDIEVVKGLADIGIIFLLFAIGAQFSFGDLRRVGKIAMVGGVAQVLIVIALGYLVGIALGWQPLEALFFGAVISNSSSTVLGKTLGERGDADSAHGRIALGWSSVQDLSTVILVAVLSALAAGGGGLLTDLLWATGKAGIFMLLLVLLGSRVLPWLFERAASLHSREIFVLTVAGVALGIAYIASLFGLSLALGAFVAGVAVAESDLSHHIVGEVTPLRDIFAGLFFVSVGMLVNPIFVIENLPLVVLTVALIILAKGVLTAVIATIIGCPARTALLTGVVLAQSAEFSFLLASLGDELGVVTSNVFSLMLAGAAISIVLSPTLYRVSLPFADWLGAHLPLSALAMHPELDGSRGDRPRAHAVICGYGRVGRVVAAALRQRGFRFVVIDQDQPTVRRLREQGVPALLGNAANPLLLERANVKQARLLAVAIPDPIVARQIVDHVKEVAPSLSIVVRTHSSAERDFLRRREVSEAVMGELELALEMTRHTLHRFGVSSLEIQAIVHGLRERVEMEDSE